jgi:RND family efflux transporter MFP subunit
VEREDTEQANRGRKKKIRLLAALFIGGLLLLTLFSNTLQTMNLTKVYTSIGRPGQLVQSFTGSGVLVPVTEASLSNQAGWAVKQVMVKAGDRVSKGQTLVVYESQEEEDRYLDAQAQLEQQRLSIEDIQDRYVEASTSGDYNQLRMTKRELKSANLTMEVQQRNLSRMKVNLIHNRELKAPFERIVMKINAFSGMTAASAGPDVRIASSGQGYQCQIQVPTAISDHLKIGQKLDVQIGSTSLEGNLTGIEHIESQMNITVAVKHESLRGGEQASIELSITSSDQGGILVPSQAIHKEGEDAYVYVVEENKGPLGSTSHVRKTFIKIGDSNESDTIVFQGIFPDSAIIQESNEPIQDGVRVRVMTK